MSETTPTPVPVKRVPKVKKVSTKNLVVGTKRPKKVVPEVAPPEVVPASGEIANAVEAALIEAIIEDVEEKIEAAADESKATKKKKAAEAISLDTAELKKVMASFCDKYLQAEKDKAGTISIRAPEVKSFVRDVNRYIKKLETHSAKLGKKKTSQRSNDSGFKIPVQISDGIAEFCEWDVATPVARIDVTNYICKYIRENNLQNPANRKIIVPDPKLKKLLSYDETQHGALTYASIQKFLAPHYTRIPAS